MLERYIAWLLRWHKLVVVVSIMVTAGVSYGAVRLTITNDTRAYFSEDNPQLAAFDALEAVYDKQETLDFVVVAKEGDLFDRETLTLLWELTELGWQAPYSRRVSSLSNYQHTTALDDDLFVQALIPHPDTLTPASIRRVREVALNEPSLVGTFVARDGSAAFVLVSLTLPEGDLSANDEVASWAEEWIPEMRARYPKVDIHLTGTTTFNHALGNAVAGDLKTLVALRYLVIVVLLIVLLRHLGGVVSTLLVISFAITSTMGTFGWFNAVLAAVAGFVPSVVMTIAVADSVHILASYYYELRRGASKEAAIAAFLRINVLPVFVTSITTVIGVLTLNFSDSPPYRDLGNMIAVGVGFAFVLSLTFLPAFLMWTGIRNPSAGRLFESLMSRFADWVIQHNKVLLVGVGVIIVVLASFIPRNVLTERWHDYFDETFEARRSLNAINEHLNWLQVIRYSVESGREHGVSSPTYLAALERFAMWYESQPEVSHVARLTHVIKRLNQNLHGDDPERYRLPESAELAAQYLLLYELSLPQGLGLENTINVDRSATQMVVYVRKSDSNELLALDRRARRWVSKNAPVLTVAEGTGLDMVFAHINHRNIRGLLKGMVIALVVISIFLIVALQSLRLALLSLLTNLAPAGLAYGTWGIVHGRIDLSAAVVMCMSIGIVVDDTVHFLSKYLYARRKKGLHGAEAMRFTFNTVGVALTVTTVVLVAGFLVLTASHFNPTVVTGALLAMTLAFALFVDFLFMPPLLIALDTQGSDQAK